MQVQAAGDCCALKAVYRKRIQFQDAFQVLSIQREGGPQEDATGMPESSRSCAKRNTQMSLNKKLTTR